MKEEHLHHEIQTPKKEQLSVSSNRKSKSIIPPSKKLHHQQHQKSTKLNASSGFAPIIEGDVVLNLSEKESSVVQAVIDADQSIVDIGNTNLNADQTLVSDDTDSARVSSISEAFVFYDDQASIESYIASFSQHISPSFITTPSSSKSPAATTPLSSITTVEMTPSSSSISAITTDAAAAAVHGATIDETKSIKLELLVKHLRESMFQVLHSSDIDPNYKKLLDSLVKTAIGQFCSSHEDRGLVVGLFSKKVKLVLLSYLVVMLLGSVGFFLYSDVQSCCYHGPPPT